MQRRVHMIDQVGTNKVEEIMTHFDRCTLRMCIIEPVAPVYTLDDLLNGITDDNRHGEVDFGGAQGQEQL